MSRIFIVILVSFLSGLGGAYFYHQILEFNVNALKDSDVKTISYSENLSSSHNEGAVLEEINAPFNYNSRGVIGNPLPPMNDDFTFASAKSTPSVVYIKTKSNVSYRRRSWMELFFDDLPSQVTVSSGSGVIYTDDGYIVTNSHVIDDADQIEVIHHKRSYEAQIVGVDPSTDLAVLKVEGKGLPNITLGNSSDLQVGEWVLAVGNPFNLTSTVTAGIVSAKGREINILKTNFPIESFIQTDAAINPGNSGGALVNRNGDLVGINTAILSRTGSYAGYGFAVPADIVRKVVDDIIEYGEVQKAFFGGDVADLTPEIARKLKTDDLSGVVVTAVQNNSGAGEAGLLQGDIIEEVDGRYVNSRSDFEELLSYMYPGDEIQVAYRRNGKRYQAKVQLTNRNGTLGISRREIFHDNDLGADFETVSKVERDLLKINNGVKITRVSDGFIKRLGIEEGFIITAINNRAIENPAELAEILTNIKGRVKIEGLNNRGVRGYYSYYF